MKPTRKASGGRANMNDAVDHLLKSLKETAGSRFIAAKRLEDHDKRLTVNAGAKMHRFAGEKIHQ
jgi:hypothetical protein